MISLKKILNEILNNYSVEVDLFVDKTASHYDITNEKQQKSFDKYKNTLLKLAKDQSNIYTDALLEADVNPEKMRAWISKKWTFEMWKDEKNEQTD